MPKRLLAVALLAAVAASAALAQGAPPAAAAAGTAKTAAAQQLKSGKPLTPAQQKMKDCSQQAKSQSLKGDARKTFMSGCLKN